MKFGRTPIGIANLLASASRIAATGSMSTLVFAGLPYRQRREPCAKSLHSGHRRQQCVGDRHADQFSNCHDRGQADREGFCKMKGGHNGK